MKYFFILYFTKCECIVKVSKSAGKRLKFARDAANFCKKYGFDGLDMDWEYPSQRDGNQLIDKRNFVLLLKELREQ